MSRLTTEQKLRLLETMWRSREGDRREGILYRQGNGWFQIASIGHEALSALALLMRREDFLFPHYRDRALVMARGMETLDCARGFLGKPTSGSGGRQLPGHFSHRSLNIWSMPSPTGSNLLPACGAAWGMQLDGIEGVVIASVGDAGMRQGEFYEAFTFAVQMNLPVVFVVEDNRYGISTPTTAMNPLRLNIFDARRILRVDGRVVDDVFERGGEAVARARRGEGPTILWCEMDRQCSHSSSDDQRQYVSEEDLAAMSRRDPIERLEAELIQSGDLDADEWAARKESMQAEIAAVYDAVNLEANPDAGDVLREVLAEVPLDENEVVLEPGEGERIVDALNTVFRRHLERDRRAIFFGEDVQDPMGGVFKLTKGLSSDYPDRVFNSPLAEATILGVGCGLASYGMRPVFEIQFIDFIGPAWNQLVTNLSTLRWRTMGQWTCPMVVYAPCGAYLPGGGPWHSQSNEAAFAHVPGIRTVVPSTPEDAAGLMATAMRAEDPTVFLIPKHLLRMRLGGSEKVRPIPFGQARQVFEGWDLTIVAWGNCVEQVTEALKPVADRVSADLFDLRSISPWDRETIKTSVLRTGRLVVVQEDNQSASVGQMIIQELIQDPAVWKALRQPPRLISRADIHVGFHPNYEWSVLPSPEDIRSVCLSLLHETLESQEAASHSMAPHATSHSTSPDSTPMNDLIHLTVPSVGEGLEEARILKFFKQPGDAVQRDEPIYQLETDKAVVDVESPSSGTLEAWDASENTIVEVGSRVGSLRPDGCTAAAAPAPVAAPSSTAETSAPETSGLAFEERPLSASQQVLAGRLARAAQVAVPATIFQSVSWQAVKAARAELKQLPDGEMWTTFSIAAWCVVDSLTRHPIFRSSLPKSSILRVYKHVHLGVAVSMGEDLTTAVVENAETTGYREFARRLRLQVERARKGQDQAGLQTSVIITSLTGMGIRDAIPVIVPPAMATLGFSSPYEELFLNNEKVESRTILNLSLTIDHRVVNGAAAAAFLNEVKERIENVSAPWLLQSTSPDHVGT